MIIHRAAGSTLQTVAEKWNFTRERVRQIESKVFNNKISFYEDKYRYIFETYDLDSKAFCKLFEEDGTSFYYLSTKFDKEKAPPSMLPSDTHINSSMMLLIKKNKSVIKEEVSF